MRGPHEGCRIEPSPHGVLTGAQVFPAQERIAIQEQRRRVAAAGDRLSPHGRHHQGTGIRTPWP